MEVDLDTVTKKQVRALVEQRLQSELVGERRTFMDRQIDHELANMVWGRHWEESGVRAKSAPATTCEDSFFYILPVS
ncbi:hypothetical protein HYQ46_006368 [Verticillium longisporum]|nr:hypothetical protein HYQ46_006368 [Verticillium longisporum]